MPARNRVTPTGEIVAVPLRGAWTGNRGILHSGTDIVRRHAGDLWITCALEFRDRRTRQWRPGHYTHLYFHDEAVSFAAGHRPCALCRRPSYDRFRAAWVDALATGTPSATQINRRLHRERLTGGGRRRRLHTLPWNALPRGAFVLVDDLPVLVLEERLVDWGYAGYGRHRPRPTTGTTRVLTPPAILGVLRAGYPVQIDDGARPATGR